MLRIRRAYPRYGLTAIRADILFTFHQIHTLTLRTRYLSWDKCSSITAVTLKFSNPLSFQADIPKTLDLAFTAPSSKNRQFDGLKDIIPPLSTSMLCASMKHLIF